ncbi:hypothetical protein PAHAL_9G532500 [Panicum hallii]|uniref:Uncharacterized protein n=1 Tax=Panicum hallii TaxID=206008 RepID=A0A2T8I5K5_9POAL|nr:hypothetical protein PAHAL_9G532500 [Panicum hallii]
MCVQITLRGPGGNSISCLCADKCKGRHIQMQVSKVCTGLRFPVVVVACVVIGQSFSLPYSLFFEVMKSLFCFCPIARDELFHVLLNLNPTYSPESCTIDARLNRKNDLQLAAIGPK